MWKNPTWLAYYLDDVAAETGDPMALAILEQIERDRKRQLQSRMWWRWIKHGGILEGGVSSDS